MTTIIDVAGSWHALQVEPGDDFDTSVIYQQEVNGVLTPIDLTGMTFSWTMTIGAVTITATVGSGLTVTALEGKIALHFSAATIATLPNGLGSHRLKILTPAPKTLIEGPLVK